MVKYVEIVTDSKDGKKYVVIAEEKTEHAGQANEKNDSHLVVVTSRNSVVLREREGKIKTNKHHSQHSGFRDERISTFKGQDAPINAVRYLIEKFNLTTNPELWKSP